MTRSKSGLGDIFDIVNGIFGDESTGPRGDPRRSYATDAQTVAGKRAEALTRTFRAEVDRKDKSYLEKVVHETEAEVLGHTDARLVKAYARACCFLEDLGRTVAAFNKLSPLDNNEEMVMGLIRYHQGRTEDAFQYLRMVENPAPDARLALSQIQQIRGQTHPAVHEAILRDILPQSYLANLTLGASYFHAGDIKNAEQCFASASNQRPDSIPARLSLFRTLVLQGRRGDVNAAMGSFYHDTYCELSPAQMEKELYSHTPGFPTFRLRTSDLYKLLP